ncbi:hypothetical protein [Cohnella luojiensis]|uniref:HTH luxR-type domain-containing protein n=1 Tax=Cohnella luojiensis TaxID=652876 RepID=A0A4Y8LT25_9BACL|nr:hypothetical protein [Cohnella luojiensis]TFE22582.1 hypothetical protein E2980_21580 [Cohnella luojiensis]
MLKNMTDWQVVKEDDSLIRHINEQFGDRYDFTESEREVLKLALLFGLEDGDILTTMQIQSATLDNHLICMLGKTRTNSTRELQALFLRYVMQKLPA